MNLEARSHPSSFPNSHIHNKEYEIFSPPNYYIYMTHPPIDKWILYTCTCVGLTINHIMSTPTPPPPFFSTHPLLHYRSVHDHNGIHVYPVCCQTHHISFFKNIHINNITLFKMNCALSRMVSDLVHKIATSSTIIKYVYEILFTRESMQYILIKDWVHYGACPIYILRLVSHTLEGIYIWFDSWPLIYVPMPLPQYRGCN